MTRAEGSRSKRKSSIQASRLPTFNADALLSEFSSNPLHKEALWPSPSVGERPGLSTTIQFAVAFSKGPMTFCPEFVGAAIDDWTCHNASMAPRSQAIRMLGLTLAQLYLGLSLRCLVQFKRRSSDGVIWSLLLDLFGSFFLRRDVISCKSPLLSGRQ